MLKIFSHTDLVSAHSSSNWFFLHKKLPSKFQKINNFLVTYIVGDCD